MRDDINSVWANGQAFLAEDTPASWAITRESRFPDVIVQAEPNFRVVANPAALSQVPIGLHGWAPESTDMHGIFLAAGSRLPNGLDIGIASVLDVYPLMLEILDIPLNTPIDGDPDALANLLQ